MRRSAASGEARGFHLVDVFTRQPLEGNPLAVVPDAEGLGEATMRALAREFHQSETTFILPALTPAAHFRLRSFTASGAEVFGAGHNALGAWWWLAVSGRLQLKSGPNDFLQEIGERVLPVVVIEEEGKVARVELKQSAPRFGCLVNDLARLATALGLEERDLVVDGLASQVVSTGTSHLLVPVRTRAALERARPVAGPLLALLQSAEAQGCYAFCCEPAERSPRVYARFFNPTVGIWEDPATGSAAGPLVCLLVAKGRARPEAVVTIEQGQGLARPSQIQVRVSGDQVWVAGSAVVMASGTLFAEHPQGAPLL